LSLKRRAKCTKGGRSLPPSFGKRGLPPILKYRIYQPSFPSVFGMKIPRKYQRVHTEIPIQDATLESTDQYREVRYKERGRTPAHSPKLKNRV